MTSIRAGWTWSGSRRGRARTRSPRSTWPGTTAGSASCSPAWPGRRPGCGGPRGAGTRRPASRTRGFTRSRRRAATGTSTGSTPISARSISSSAAISPTPARSTSTGTSTPSGNASGPGSRSPRWTTGSALSATRPRSSGSATGRAGQKIYRFAGKWLARLPQPFTRADEEADYRWQLPDGQAGFSTTMALDRPLSGRVFSGQLIRDNLDIGRPDKVNIVFGRMIRRRGKYRTPGTFRTQVITSGTCPYVYLFCKKTQDGQYLKEGRALRTETTFNQPRDLGIGKELTNLAALAEVGYSANRRLLDAECISHDPAAGTAALEMLTSPVISTTCTRVPGMRFPDPRVQALLGACCALALRPAGFTSRDLRHYLAPQLGKTPEDMTGGQISYDLRRLRAHQIIQRIPHSRAYQVTADGLSIALFLTRLTQRLLTPGLAQLTSPGPPGRSQLRQADRAYRDALTDLARQASLAALPHLQLSPAVITSLSSAVTHAAT